MNEIQRQAYLQAMGIQLYFPRKPLPGAKSSPNYEVVVPAEKIKSSAANGAGVQNRSKLVGAPSQPKPEKLESAQPVTRTETGENSTTVPAEHPGQPIEQDTLRFRINYYRISDSLAIIDEVPHQLARREASATLNLLRAILRALSVDISSCEFRAESLDWPLGAGISMKNDPAVEAKQALLGFITMRQQTDKFSNLVVFAAQIDQLLLSSGEDPSRDFLSADKNHQWTVTHSLHSMLAFPNLKREVWVNLQALRQRLAQAMS